MFHWSKANPDKYLVHRCRARVKSKTNNQDRGICTITAEDVTRQRNKQHNRCFWTNRLMDTVYSGDYSVSIDRLDPEMGYTPDNIVLCCKWINIARGDRTVEETRVWLRDICVDLYKLYRPDPIEQVMKELGLPYKESV